MKKELDKEYKSNTKEIESLRKNFPSCFDKEGNFNIEKFQSLIGEDTNIVKEGYKLDWLGKSYSRLLVNTPVTTILTEDKLHNELEENKDSNNLYIEGDNLEVLKHLTNAYSEKVKMIYIDPPYNTGTDFIYQDDRKFTPEELSKMANIDEEEAKRVLDFTNSKSNSHSAWLTFMYPRLYIARELLKEDGVIFISIDDNEQAQLKLLCDEVFGENNVENYIWDLHDPTEGSFTKTASHTVRKLHEHFIVCYKKEVKLSKFKEYRFKERNDFGNSDNDPRGNWMSGNISRNGIISTSGSKYFEIVTPTGKSYTRNWTISEKELKELCMDNRIYFSNGGEGVPRLKIFQNESSQSIQSSIFKNLKSSSSGKNLLTEIMGSHVFDFPKPIELICRFLEISNSKSNLILDFFSGSATTAHSIMQLNAEDNGNRKYIMVQLPEEIDSKKSKSAFDFCINNNLEPIIPSIAKERIKRASRKIIEENKDKEYIGNIDFGFKVFKTEELENSNYLNELEAFDSGQGNLLGGNLSKQDLYNLALTWKTHDGVELTNSFKEVLFNEYKGLMVENKLYLMYNDFNTECLRKVLEFNDSSSDDIINNIIIYGYNFSSQSIKELSEGIKVRNKKSAELELEVRF